MKAVRLIVTTWKLLAASLALAAPANNTLQVSATIVNSCTASGTTLNFGSAIDVLATSGPLDATSALNVTCTNTTPYTISLNAGSNAGGASNFGSRTMKSGGNSMSYQLYIDTSRSSIWGDGSAGSSTVAGVGTGSSQSLSLYGRIASLAHVVPGSYSDTVTVTISY